MGENLAGKRKVKSHQESGPVYAVKPRDIETRPAIQHRMNTYLTISFPMT